MTLKLIDENTVCTMVPGYRNTTNSENNYISEQ